MINIVFCLYLVNNLISKLKSLVNKPIIIISKMNRKSYLIIILLIMIDLAYTLNVDRHTQNNHQIFDDTWTGSKCNDACELKNGVVCGNVAK